MTAAHRIRPLIAALCVASCATGATARQSPPPTPTPTATATASPAPPLDEKEQAVLTERAQAFYGHVVAGKVDRTKIGDALNAALSDATLQTISGQLGALGTGRWKYIGPAAPPAAGYAFEIVYPTITLRVLYLERDGNVVLFFVGPKPAA